MRRVTSSFVMSAYLSVRPRGTTIPLDGFSRNMIIQRVLVSMSRKFKLD